MTTTHLDTCLELASDGLRRAVIHQLRYEVTGETTVADLVDRLLESGAVSSVDERTDRERLAIRLSHDHLPKLDDHGVVAFDRERRTVRYESDDRVEAVLDALPAEAAQTTH